MAPTPEPQQRLPSRARTAWRLSGVASALPLLVAGLWLRGVLGAEDSLPGAVVALPLVVALVAAVAGIVAVPELRWRRWRYEIRPHEMDIRHGAFTVRRTIVPMARIQHVDTEQGLIQQWLGLATVKFHTAAGANEIPQLDRGQAALVRDRIAELTRELDDV